MVLVPATQEMLFMARRLLARLAVLLSVTTLLVILNPGLVAADWGENWGVMQWAAVGDADGDGILDGDDNCPFVPNNSQTNSDQQPAGDACQCGDVNNDFIVDGLDAQIARENLVGHALSGSFDPERCNVIGNSDCGVDDVFILGRLAEGLPVSLQNICDAYLGP
jgi:hypothetical protein